MTDIPRPAILDGHQNPGLSGPSPAAYFDQIPLQQGISNEHLDQLRSQLQGDLVINSPDHPAQPPVWNGLLRSTSPVLRTAIPSYYVHCKTVDDAALAVEFSLAHKIKIHAKGCGHHYGGACLPHGGMVVDMSRLKGITIDPGAQTAMVQPGVTSGELYAALAPHGLHFPAGHISQVGVAGFILGGGNGWGVRLYGAAGDSVLGFEALLLDGSAVGQMVVVDADNHADLFWGLKGAGMFLAVVTAFHLQLHPVPAHLPSLTAIYPLPAARKVGKFFREFHTQSPAAIEASMVFVGSREPPHTPVVVLSCNAFSASAEIEQWYDKVRALLPDQRLHLFDSHLPYCTALSSVDEAWDWPDLCLYGHGMFVPVPNMDGDMLGALQQHAAAMSSPRSMILVAPSCPISPRPSALSFRDCLFVAPYAMWPRTQAGPSSDGDERHVAWVREVQQSVQQHGVVGTYINEVMLDQPGQVEGCYSPETYARLKELKFQYDPWGLLREL